MREAVATKLDGITRYHDHMKQKRFGFLVRPAVLIIGWFVVITLVDINCVTPANIGIIHATFILFIPCHGDTDKSIPRNEFICLIRGILVSNTPLIFGNVSDNVVHFSGVNLYNKSITLFVTV